MSSPLQRIAADVASQAIYTFNTTRKQRLKRAGLKDTREASSQEPGVSGGPSAPLPTGFSLFKKSDDPSKPAMPARSGIGKWNVMISEGWKNLPEARKNEFKEKAAQQRKKREEEELAAKTYAEFLDEFEGGGAQRKGRGFVRAGGSSVAYTPQGRGSAGAGMKAFEEERGPSVSVSK